MLGELLARLERESFYSPRLVALRRLLDTRAWPPSARFTLHRLVELHDWQHNLIFLIPSLAFLWGTHLAWAIEAWRRDNGRHLIRLWLEAVGEFEALSSLSPIDSSTRTTRSRRSSTSPSRARFSMGTTSAIRSSPRRAACATTSR